MQFNLRFFVSTERVFRDFIFSSVYSGNCAVYSPLLLPDFRSVLTGLASPSPFSHVVISGFKKHTTKKNLHKTEG